MPILYQTPSQGDNDTFEDNGTDAFGDEPLAVGGCHPFATSMTKKKQNLRSIYIKKKNEDDKTAADPRKHNFQWGKLSLAQDEDIQACYDRIVQAHEFFDQQENTGHLMMGASRGAATVFTTLANKYDEITNISHDLTIAGAIMEAPFARVQGDIESKIYFNRPIMKIFSHHDTKGITPLRSVETFPDNIPVLFISSLVDDIVPYESTEKLALALFRKRQQVDNAEPVYMLTLDHSSHVGYAYEHPDDRKKYMGAVHAFRKQCGLSYIEKHVNDLVLNDAQLTFEDCQLNTENHGGCSLFR